MKLFLTQRPEPRLYLEVQDAEPLMLKSIDPIKWARKFDDKNKEYPKSDADLADSRHDLYLDVGKANPHKEPVKGQFMHGGGGAAKGKGQQDVSDLVDEMMNTAPKKESAK